MSGEGVVLRRAVLVLVLLTELLWDSRITADSNLTLSSPNVTHYNNYDDELDWQIDLPLHYDCEKTELSGKEFYFASDQSCVGRCDAQLWAPCYCGEECLVYGDCCLDYEAACLDTEDKAPNFTRRFEDKQLTKMECRYIDYGYKLVMSRCPDDAEDKETKNLCERPNSDARKELIRSIPFVRGDLIYSNVYCAICWGKATFDDIESLEDTVDVICKGSSITIELSETPEEYFTQVKKHCSFTPNILPPFYKQRHCAIDDQSYAELETKHQNTSLCFSYSARVILGGYNVHRNVHCALLQEPDLMVFECLDRNYYDQDMHSPPVLVSFAMLLDLRRSPPSPRAVGLNESCPENFTRSKEVQLCTSPAMCAERKTNNCWDSAKVTDYLERKVGRPYHKVFTFIVVSDGRVDKTLLKEKLLKYGLHPNVNMCWAEQQHLAEGNQTCLLADMLTAHSLKSLHKIVQAALLNVHGNGVSRWVLSSSQDFLEDYVKTFPSNCSVEYYIRHDEHHVVIGIPVALEGNNTSSCVTHARRVTFNCSDVRVAILSEESSTEESFQISDTSSAFICVNNAPVEIDKMTVEEIVTLVCQTLSILSLLLCLSVYMALPNLRTIPGQCVMCLCSALLVAQVLLQFGSSARSFRSLCIALAALDHWAWLTTFSWMVILAYDISSTMGRDTLTDNQVQSRQFRWYMGLASGVPLLVVSICLVIAIERPELMSYTDGAVCWISSGMVSLLLSFALPLSIALIFNVVFFVRTVVAIRRVASLAEHAKDASQRQSQLIVYVRLASLMGFTWVLGLLQNPLPYAGVRFAFIVCNSLQGVSIMVAFVCKRRVLRMIRARFSGAKRTRSSSSSTTKSKITTNTSV